MLCIINNSIKYQSFVYTQLNDQTVLFQAIHFESFVCIRIWYNFYFPIDITLSGATTTGKSGSRSVGIEGLFCISQSSNITVAQSSNCLGSYQDTRWGSYPAAETQSAYSTALADYANPEKEQGNILVLKDIFWNEILKYWYLKLRVPKGSLFNRH